MAEPNKKDSHDSLLSDLDSTASQRSSEFTELPVPTLRELCELPVANCWYQLGVQLGIPGHELDIIEQNYPRDAKLCRSKMFGAWLRGESAPTYEKVVKALIAVDKTSLAKMLCEKHGTLHVIRQSHSSSPHRRVLHGHSLVTRLPWTWTLKWCRWRQPGIFFSHEQCQG